MERKIKFYRKQSDCLYFEKSNFTRLVREIAQNFSMHIKFTNEAKIGLQLLSEDYLHQLFDKARDIVKLRGNFTLYADDLSTARNFCGTTHIRNVSNYR